MSLLDNGPHTVTVYPEETAEDFHGNVIERPSITGVTVSGCFMQPLRSQVDVSQGQHALVMYRLIARSAPAGPWSRVRWVDDNGIARSFSVADAPKRSNASRLTSHVNVLLREER